MGNLEKVLVNSNEINIHSLAAELIFITHPLKQLLLVLRCSCNEAICPMALHCDSVRTARVQLHDGDVLLPGLLVIADERVALDAARRQHHDGRPRRPEGAYAAVYLQGERPGPDIQNPSPAEWKEAGSMASSVASYQGKQHAFLYDLTTALTCRDLTQQVLRHIVLMRKVCHALLLLGGHPGQHWVS